MAVISDLLGIPHFTTSRGSTVRSDFLVAVLVALGGSPTGLNKDELMLACVAAATRTSPEPDLVSPGGTITNRALQIIIDGITEHGIPGKLPSHRVERVSSDLPVEFEFDPTGLADERERSLAERAVREGQDAFRSAVLRAYSSACALTGTDAPPALEAAHITPYRGPKTNVVVNGICLRADLHRLWDSGQVALDETSMQICVSDALRATTYGTLHGIPAANLPRRTADRPSRAALRAHREWCRL
jgi:putative restriction endonuclease